MIAGFVLFDSSDLQAIIEFAVSVQLLGDLNTMVYNATFAALSFANGQADPSQRFYALSGFGNTTQQYKGFTQMQTDSWRSNSYQFCGHGCLGLVAVNFFDTYSTAINKDYHQVQNGSCRNTFSLNESGMIDVFLCMPPSSQPTLVLVLPAISQLYLLLHL